MHRILTSVQKTSNTIEGRCVLNCKSSIQAYTWISNQQKLFSSATKICLAEIHEQTNILSSFTLLCIWPTFRVKTCIREAKIILRSLGKFWIFFIAQTVLLQGTPLMNTARVNKERKYKNCKGLVRV